MLHAEWARVLLADEDGTVLEASLDAAGELTVVRAAANTERLHRAALVAGVATLLSAQADSLDPIAGLCGGEVLAAPIAGSSGPMGTLLVGDRSGEVRRFSAADLRRLSALAGHASVAIENSHLMERLRQKAEEREHQSLHDALTGLPNRTLFSHELTAALGAGVAVAVLLLDLDRFKEVNDTLGHHNGDSLLQQVGTRLRATLRTGDVVARLGGDEFAVLLPDIHAEHAAVHVARGIVELLEAPFAIGEISVDVGASIGIAVAPEHGTDAGTLIQRADVAMYTAKADQTGVEVYRPDRDSYSAERLTLVSDLRRALHDGTLQVHYQPQVDLVRSGVFGVEALVRWEHPTKGRIPPDDFIAMAEHTGLIRPLTQVVLDEALGRCREWRDSGWSLRVSVNLSARSLLQPTLADDMAALLARHRLPADALCLEVTETSIMADPRRTIPVLENLRALGVTIAVDDFGTGHSSLAYLKRLPVGEIKIDKSFVLSMLSDTDDEAIVRTIVDLARNLRLPLVAEGVEDEETASRLRDLGCRAAQGYHFARPMPASELLGWLANHPRSSAGAIIVPLLPSPQAMHAGMA
jgi:diguanylate cyclase (GGDEF)-like protein